MNDRKKLSIIIIVAGLVFLIIGTNGAQSLPNMSITGDNTGGPSIESMRPYFVGEWKLLGITTSTADDGYGTTQTTYTFTVEHDLSQTLDTVTGSYSKITRAYSIAINTLARTGLTKEQMGTRILQNLNNNLPESQIFKDPNASPSATPAPTPIITIPDTTTSVTTIPFFMGIILVAVGVVGYVTGKKAKEDK
jgi:hypothetical protein